MSGLKRILASVAAASAFSAAALADPSPVYSLKDRFRTVFSIGLQWNFGDSQAQLVLAARGTETRSDNEVHGVKADLAIPLKLDSFAPTVRLLGVVGNRDVQGEFGLGWSFAQSRLIGGFGVQAPWTNVGVNVSEAGFAPFLGVNSIRRAPGPIPVIINTNTCC